MMYQLKVFGTLLFVTSVLGTKVTKDRQAEPVQCSACFIPNDPENIHIVKRHDDDQWDKIGWGQVKFLCLSCLDKQSAKEVRKNGWQLSKLRKMVAKWSNSPSLGKRDMDAIKLLRPHRAREYVQKNPEVQPGVLMKIIWEKKGHKLQAADVQLAYIWAKIAKPEANYHDNKTEAIRIAESYNRRRNKKSYGVFTLYPSPESEERERLERERLEKEKKDREERERLEKEKKDREERERLEKEKKDREERERLEKEKEKRKKNKRERKFLSRENLILAAILGLIFLGWLQRNTYENHKFEVHEYSSSGWVWVLPTFLLFIGAVFGLHQTGVLDTTKVKQLGTSLANLAGTMKTSLLSLAGKLTGQDSPESDQDNNPTRPKLKRKKREKTEDQSVWFWIAIIVLLALSIPAGAGCAMALYNFRRNDVLDEDVDLEAQAS